MGEKIDTPGSVQELLREALWMEKTQEWVKLYSVIKYCQEKVEKSESIQEIQDHAFRLKVEEGQQFHSLLNLAKEQGVDIDQFELEREAWSNLSDEEIKNVRDGFEKLENAEEYSMKFYGRSAELLKDAEIIDTNTEKLATEFEKFEEMEREHLNNIQDILEHPSVTIEKIL